MMSANLLAVKGGLPVNEVGLNRISAIMNNYPDRYR